MNNYLGKVEDALALFQSPIVSKDQAEFGKAQLTRLAAWLIFGVDPSVRLFEKTSGNQVNGRSVDLVMLPDGFADIATEVDLGNGLVEIKAQWIANDHDGNTSNQGRWLKPTADIANEAGPMTLSAAPPEPEPDPEEPEPSLDGLAQLIAAAVVAQLPQGKKKFKGTATGSLPLLGKVKLDIVLEEQ